MNNTEAQEIFNRLWDLEHELHSKGFPIKYKMDGRQLNFQILRTGLSFDDRNMEIELYDDEYDIVPICDDSKWLLRVYGSSDIFYDNVTFDAPKELKAKIKSLTQFVKKQNAKLVELYFEANYSFRCKSKKTDLAKYLSSIEKHNQAIENQKHTKRFKINPSYTAIFTETGTNVKVGCQTISKSVIKELAAQL